MTRNDREAFAASAVGNVPKSEGRTAALDDPWPDEGGLSRITRIREAIADMKLPKSRKATMRRYLEQVQLRPCARGDASE